MQNKIKKFILMFHESLLMTESCLVTRSPDHIPTKRVTAPKGTALGFTGTDSEVTEVICG